MIPLIRALIAKLELYIQPGSFLRNLAVLGSGTAIAQLIPILSSPVLTRLYLPEDFGIFAVFMAITSTFMPIICGKYEVALVLPRSSEEARHLLGIAFYFSLAISCILGTLFFFSGERVLLLLNAVKLGSWLMAIPVALVLTGIFTALSYYANRNKQYKLLSKARIARSAATAIVSVSAGVFSIGFGGLLTGFFIGLVAAFLLFLTRNREVLSRPVFIWNKTKKNLIWRYRHYPIYNATTGLLDGITMSLPVFFLSRYFPESVLGYYSIVLRVTLSPMSFISSSVSQINLKKVVDLVNNGKPVIPYLLKLAALLALIILIPSMVIIIWGPDLFFLIFGDKWAMAGEYARILMPALAIQFVSSTLSSTLGATNNNRIGAVWKVMSFFCTFAVLYWLAPKGDIGELLCAITMLNIVLYLCYFGAILIAAHKPRNFL